MAPKRKKAERDSKQPVKKRKTERVDFTAVHANGADRAPTTAADVAQAIAMAAATVDEGYIPSTAPALMVPSTPEVVKKAKKEKRDKKEKKKRKREEEEDVVPTGVDGPNGAAADPEEEVGAGGDDVEGLVAPESTVSAAANGKHKSKRTKKKEKKEKRATGVALKAASKAEAANEEPADDDVDGDTAADGEAQAATADADAEAGAKGGRQRFIAFIGNLPFDTTTAALERHFAAIRPDSIRHLTVKDGEGGEDDDAKSKAKKGNKKTKSGKDGGPGSKGYAFLEFASYDRLLTCLKLYHHSLFSADGQHLDGDGNPAVDAKGREVGRRINVELTAGGGGTSQHRRDKLKAKNERLAQQRERRALAEKAKEAQSVAAAGAGKPSHEATDDSAPPPPSSMHPDRIAMVGGADDGARAGAQTAGQRKSHDRGFGGRNNNFRGRRRG